MRHSKDLVGEGSVRTRGFRVRHVVIGIAVCVGIGWGGVAFAQEAYVSHKLNQQVSDLRRQNAVLAEQNAGYRKDVQALTSGSANEEEARNSGYARPNERLFLVTPPSPSPSPSPAPHP